MQRFMLNVNPSNDLCLTLTLDSYSCSFQYKILNSALYLNKKLFTFRKLTSPLCPFCKLSDETVFHLFYEYNITLNLWNELFLYVMLCW